MDVPIRTIGVATTVFWAILILFAVSLVYSVKDLQFGFGEPQTSAAQDGNITVSMPINVTNNGYYDLGSFNVTSTIFDDSGLTIAWGSTIIPVIAKGRAEIVYHNLTLDVGSLLQRDQNYLFDDTQLSVAESVSMKLAELIPVQASGNFSIHWGAPLYNFTLEQPKYAEFNFTHVRMMVPLRFENHASFGFSGDVRIRMYNDAGSLVGTGDTAIEVPQRSSFKGDMEFWAMASLISTTGRLEIEFQTPFFSYGPEVIPYG